MSAVDILFRDDYLVAVHKPAGLLVHRSPIDRHETRFALQEVRDLLGCRVYPVHRLDKPTSGVLVFALDPATARSLGDAFAGGLADKTYLAVTRGIVPPEGIIDHPLSAEPDRLDSAKSSPAAPQPAVTAFRRLAEAELPVATGRHATSRYSLAELSPRTGRRHQLRRHMKHIFHPIIGDTTYGEGRHNRFFRQELGCGRLLLHAAELSLPHPASGEILTIAAPPDRELARLLDRLGWLAAATGRRRPVEPAPP